MNRPIVRSRILLARPSAPATPDDLATGADLKDTLLANADRCAGLAANMIGVSKCIIAFFDEGQARVMYNPRIIYGQDEYQAEEGCLSLDGVRPATRYRLIRVSYCDEAFTQHEETLRDWCAQVVQHEIDHCNGVVI